ncbi:MAG: hypothetical protein M3495_04200, partial [Pseudomonadota bacterium]|nr:hypothetical protein [Pseudomonadota bacterium]
MAVLLFFISFTVLAKDEAPKGGTKIEANATKKYEDAEQSPLPLPLPVRIVEEPTQSDDAKSRADHASSNEDQDLQAQQSMASSAERQLVATYVVITLSFFGTCLLIWTVVETRKTANAAWHSVRIAGQGISLARETGEKQLRAYIGITQT